MRLTRSVELGAQAQLFALAGVGEHLVGDGEPHRRLPAFRLGDFALLLGALAVLFRQRPRRLFGRAAVDRNLRREAGADRNQCERRGDDPGDHQRAVGALARGDDVGAIGGVELPRRICQRGSRLPRAAGRAARTARRACRRLPICAGPRRLRRARGKNPPSPRRFFSRAPRPRGRADAPAALARRRDRRWWSPASRA